MSTFGTPVDNDSALSFDLDESQLAEVMQEGPNTKDYSVPEGKYVARIVNVQGKTSQAGNKMLEWTFEGESTELIKGKSYRYYTVLKSDNLTYFLKAVKYQPGMKPNDLIGKPVKLHLVTDAPYTKPDGSTVINSKIKSVYPLE